jgi:putative salt-induced outer membrane protein YdiY
MTLVLPVLAMLAALGAEKVPTAAASPAIAPEDVPPPVYPEWRGALTLGATWTDGNTETETVTGAFNAVRRDEMDRWTFDAFTNYGSSTDTVTDDKDTTTNNSGGGAKYDYFWSEKTYLFGNTSAKVDHIADLDLRAILGAGIGYQWKETDKVKWGTEAGFSYVDENFDDSEFDEEFLAARLASNLAYQISKSASFEQIAEVLPSLEDSEDVIAKIDNRLKLNITGRWIAQIQYVLDFDGSVPTGTDPGPDGNEETDHRVVLGIGWSFGPEA